MKLTDIIRKLPLTLNLTTLGGASDFTVVNCGGVVLIINSSGSYFELDDSIVSTVYKRYTALPVAKRHMASEYVQPKWPTTPNTIFSPYIARIISYIGK